MCRFETLGKTMDRVILPKLKRTMSRKPVRLVSTLIRVTLTQLNIHDAQIAYVCSLMFLVATVNRVTLNKIKLHNEQIAHFTRFNFLVATVDRVSLPMQKLDDEQKAYVPGSNCGFSKYNQAQTQDEQIAYESSFKILDKTVDRVTLPTTNFTISR